MKVNMNEYFTYKLLDEKTQRVVLRGIPKITPVSEIEENLTSMSIYNLAKLKYIKIRTESQCTRGNILQYHRSKNFDTTMIGAARHPCATAAQITITPTLAPNQGRQLQPDSTVGDRNRSSNYRWLSVISSDKTYIQNPKFQTHSKQDRPKSRPLPSKPDRRSTLAGNKGMRYAETTKSTIHENTNQNTIKTPMREAIHQFLKKEINK